MCFPSSKPKATQSSVYGKPREMEYIERASFVEIYGFGVCFDLGKKCSKMHTLYIPSLWVNPNIEMAQTYGSGVGDGAFTPCSNDCKVFSSNPATTYLRYKKRF